MGRRTPPLPLQSGRVRRRDPGAQEPRSASRRRARAMACAACLLTAACASAPPGTSTRLPTGDYQGTLAVGGRSFLTTLRLRPDGATAVRGLLQVVSPVTIEGRVTGRVVDDLLRITVAYRGADGCESRIEGILDVIDEAARLDGPVMVSDCGDPIAGRLRVER